MYFDIVSEDLLKNEKLLELENIFNSLKIRTVYVTKVIKNKKDYESEFILPSLDGINLKKAYILENLNFIPEEKDVLKLGFGGSVSNISRVLNNKNIKYLLNPVGDKLIFDEESARLSRINNFKIIFNINLWRNSTNSIKQTIFLIKILKKHMVDMSFCTLARNKSELLDPVILKDFLYNFNLNREIIDRFLDDKILC